MGRDHGDEPSVVLGSAQAVGALTSSQCTDRAGQASSSRQHLRRPAEHERPRAKKRHHQRDYPDPGNHE